MPRKPFSILAAILSMCLLLSGCMASSNTIKVNPDGSGTVNIQAGYSVEAIEAILALMETPDEVAAVQSELETMDVFDLNGTKYCGVQDSKSFSSVEEFNRLFASGGSDNLASDVEELLSLISLSKLTDPAGFELVVYIPMEAAEQLDGSTDTFWPTDDEAFGDASELEVLMQSSVEDMVWTVQVEMPYPVKQTAGNTKGITINGNTITLDYVQLSTLGVQELRFTSLSSEISAPIAPAVPSVNFTDVNKSDWFYAPVAIMADGKLVNGFEDGTFGPNKNITVPEFCTMLCRAMGLNTEYSINSWWAAGAVKSCLDAGYIVDRGSLMELNYDVPITREEAVAAMVKAARPQPVGDSTWTAKDIPDFGQIDKKFSAYIVPAYNSGLCKGSDDAGTFFPKSNLTRAEVCQLFVNINLTSAPK